VPTPVSPVDGYAYSRNEVIYRPRLASSRQPDSSFVPGQFFFPSLAFSDTGSGNLIVVPYILYVVGQLSSGGYAPGTVICKMYFSVSGTASQGTVHVTAFAQRESEQLPAGVEVEF